MFGPGIELHPHNGALQVWLELGVIGAVAAAAFWGVTLSRLSRAWSDLLIAATRPRAAVYLLFGMFNFGVWQEWWLALGALIADAGGDERASTVEPARRSRLEPVDLRPYLGVEGPASRGARRYAPRARRGVGAMTERWTPASWRSKPAKHMPADYPDPAALAARRGRRCAACRRWCSPARRGG